MVGEVWYLTSSGALFLRGQPTELHYLHFAFLILGQDFQLEQKSVDSCILALQLFVSGMLFFPFESMVSISLAEET